MKSPVTNTYISEQGWTSQSVLIPIACFTMNVSQEIIF